jgi:hypothetical protein
VSEGEVEASSGFEDDAVVAMVAIIFSPVYVITRITTEKNEKNKLSLTCAM